MVFKNRQEAGKKLATKLLSHLVIEPLSNKQSLLLRNKQSLLLRNKQSLLLRNKIIVLAIPRGGVVIGKELATVLNCPLDVIVTKKIGAPGNPELAVGAVGPFEASTELSRTSYAQGEPVIDEELAGRVGADEKYLKSQIAKLRTEVDRRIKEYHGDKPPLELKNKVVIITDDGVATGATMMAAVEIARQQNPKKIIVAVPVIAKDTLEKIEKLADEVVYLDAPEMFFAVGQFYREFEQISDEEVVRLLR